MLRWIALLTLIVSLAPVVASQPRSEAPHLLDRWVVQQREAVDAIEFLRLVEATERRIESPFKSRLILFEHVLSVRDRQVSRELQRATIDGHHADGERVQELEARLGRALGPEWSQARRLADAPAYFLGRLRPVGTPQRDRLDSAPVWRVELRAPAGEEGIEHATLWFGRDRDLPVLLQSRVLLRGREDGNEVSINTRYSAIDGPAGPLAIPRRQTVDAQLQQQRRWRTFTVIVHSEREASQIELRWRRRAER